MTYLYPPVLTRLAHDRSWREGERESEAKDDIRFDEIKRVLVVRLDEVTESEGSARETERETRSTN